VPPRRGLTPAAAGLGGGGPKRGGFTVHRAPVAPIGLYSQVSGQLPISGAQGLATFGASGKVTISLGPTGLGTTWYPASAVISTTVGQFDTSSCSIYVGPAGVPTTLQGTLFTGGGGVLALAIPAMSPGLYIIAVWTGGTAGSTASINVTGTQTALMRTA
jgi:hypothetical protein